MYKSEIDRIFHRMEHDQGREQVLTVGLSPGSCRTGGGSWPIVGADDVGSRFVGGLHDAFV